MQKYIYKATILKVRDGDTIEAKVDVGFGISTDQTIRFSRINAQEKKDDPALWQKWKEFVEKWLNAATEVYVQTFPDKENNDKTDGFKRYIGEVYNQDKICLNSEMLLAGCPGYKRK